MRVLVVTTWYPTAASPATGVFVARDVAALATRHDVRVLHLVAPALLGEEPAGYAAAPAARAGSPTVPQPVRVPVPVEFPAGVPVPVEFPAGVPVERLVMDPRRPDHVLRAARRVWALARHADLVHTMAVSALLPMTGWRPHAPWVHTEHWSGLTAPGTLTPALRVARQGVRRLLRRPDVVAVVGEGLAEGVRELRSGPVVVVPNIVTVPDVRTPRRDPAGVLADRGALELVAVGGLVERKDPVTAVDAAAELRRRGVDARLTWVGEGPLRDRTVRRAEELGVPLRTTGAVDPAAVAGLVSAADLFLLPTRAETFCVAAAEALACGRPVVVGDSAGPRAFVAPPSGLLVAPGAPAAEWADAVEKVWEASAALSAEDIAAPVAAAYGAEAYAARVDAVYSAAAAPSHRAHGVSPNHPTGPTGCTPDHPTGPTGCTPDHPTGPTGCTPEVDVVVATHSAERAVDRAVRSVLDGSEGVAVRVTVVCHDLPADEVGSRLSHASRADPRVRLIEHHDGVRSPAGPFTAGLDAATAPWVSLLGSDDRLSRGALRHWLDVATSTGAEVVLATIELDAGAVPTPPTRVRPAPGGLRRHGDLDLVRDRLSYRSAPLGLISRAAMRRTGAYLLAGAQTGEDIPFATRLYAGSRVALAQHAPYLVGTDAADRTTAAPRPVAAELAAVSHLLADPWLHGLPADRRAAVATKLLRIHVFGTVLNRPDPGWWTAAERGELARVAAGLVEAAGGAVDALSLADHDLLAAILDPGLPAEEMLSLALARRRFGTPRTLLPHDWRRALSPEAPARFMTSSLAARLVR